ncbi:unnamed protein product [Brachionus calyciflorus]|uniref:Uncharacterized protein n=1 Tax=Brachionus calyciflorus TaxID=104777 RepID=A0A814GR09_9BILA|nr:unnamed protein product [Brachionus calyciflorus]
MLKKNRNLFRLEFPLIKKLKILKKHHLNLQLAVFDLDKIKDKNNWPQGVVIGRYKKPYAERVNQQFAESSSNSTSQIN